MSKLLDELNEEQQAIVKETTGKILVLAGAGTGKTRTLTYRIAYAIEQGLAASNEILAVTFTNKAAAEMKERIANLVEVTDRRNWWIGTFHGICVRILMRYGNEIGILSHFSIADEKEQKALIKEILSNTTELGDMEPDTMLGIISAAKNNLMTPQDLMEEFKASQAIPKAYEEYQTKLQKMNALDFDDLIMRTVELLNKVPEVRKKYQEQFKYVLVDESQDLNKAQYELAKIFSEQHGNLVLIGDSDQGIYSWRGANIDIINSFASLPNTKIMKLEENYRCTKTIVEASNAVVINNKDRLDKTLITNNPTGEKIVCYTADTQYQEAGFVAGIIDYCCHISKENDYKDFTILYRTNTQSRVIEDELTKHFIPYTLIGGLSFYERKEVKDMLAYLKLIVNPHDILSLQRIINEPKRGIGKTTVQKIIDLIDKTEHTAVSVLNDIEGNIGRVSAKAKEALKDLQKILVYYTEQMDELTPERLIKELAIATGYLDMLDKQDEEDRVMNVYELASIAGVMYNEEGVDLDGFVKHMSLITSSDEIEDDNVVKLMTAHTAKGLEFPIVFIIGLEENIFPHFLSLRSKNTAELEEERRLFYVSMTRAQKKLYLSNAEERSLFGKTVSNPPSRFLKEIPSKLKKKV